MAHSPHQGLTNHQDKGTPCGFHTETPCPSGATDTHRASSVIFIKPSLTSWIPPAPYSGPDPEGHELATDPQAREAHACLCVAHRT